MNKIYSRIESIVGSVITVKADNVAYGELAEIETVFGKSLAEVNKIDGDTVSLQVFAGGRGVSTGDHIRFLGHRMEVSFSENFWAVFLMVRQNHAIMDRLLQTILLQLADHL